MMTTDSPAGQVARPRIGLVGTGPWARIQASALAGQRDWALTTVWGRTPAATHRLADEFGIAAASSLDELFAVVDLVWFAVAPSVQPEFAIRASEAGVALVLDKPVGTDLEALERLERSVARSGVQVRINYNRLLMPSVAAAIDIAGLGDTPRRIEVEIDNGALAPGNAFGESAWRRRPGAALWDLGPHALSVATALLGDVVSSSMSVVDGRVEVESVHESGSESYLALSIESSIEQESYLITDAGGATRLVSPTSAASTGLVDALLATFAPDAVSDGSRMRLLTDLSASVRMTRTLISLSQQQRTSA